MIYRNSPSKSIIQSEELIQKEYKLKTSVQQRSEISTNPNTTFVYKNDTSNLSFCYRLLILINYTVCVIQNQVISVLGTKTDYDWPNRYYYFS